MELRKIMTGKGDVVQSWGIWVTVGYVCTQLMALGQPFAGQEFVVMSIWTLAMLPPIRASYREVRQAEDPLTLNAAWAAVIAFSVIGNWVGMAFLNDPELLLQSYYHKWFLIGAFGFAGTAWKATGTSRKIYSLAALLNMAMVTGLEQSPLLLTWAFGIAAIIQGGPMLLDWHVHR
jgi:hypothetical protein